MNKTGISYLRFSTAEQKFGNSTQRQLSIFTEWCARNGLSPDLNASIADEGLSAYKGDHLKKHGALGIFLGAVKDGKFPNHVLVAENLDRISRQGPKIARKIIEQIVDNGVDIHVCNINVQLSPGWENDPSRSIIVDVELGRACKESVYKSERVGKAWSDKKSKAENGLALTSMVPAWLKAEKVVKGNGSPVTVIPERAATVRKIFQLAAEGLGAYRIAAKLKADGDEPFGSKGWTLPYIKKILKNRAVLGEFQPRKRINGVRFVDGNPVPKFFPRVISTKEWNAARESVTKRTHNYLNSKTGELMSGWKGGRTGSDTSLFTGLLYDKTLDGRRIGFRGKSGRGKADYLVTAYEAGKPQHAMRYDRFEAAFLSFIEDLDWKAVAGFGESDEVKVATSQLETTLIEIDRTSQKITQLQKLVEEGSFSTSLFEALDAAKAKLIDAASRKDKLAAAVASARAKVASLHNPEELIDIIKSGDPERRLRLKSEIAKRVARIDIEFSKDRKPVQAIITLINGFRDFILFQR